MVSQRNYSSDFESNIGLYFPPKPEKNKNGSLQTLGNLKPEREDCDEGERAGNAFLCEEQTNR